MKAILAIIFFGSLIFNPAFAEKSEVVVSAIDYSCAEMQEIVEIHDVVYVEGLGSRNVYANAYDACAGDMPGQDAYWFQTYWETNDSSACRVGFGCRAYRTHGGDLPDGDIPDTKKSN